MAGAFRQMFAGTHTPDGFCSYFDSVARPSPGRVYILKGGPGAGKSTLMRKLADDFSALGRVVEIFRCSSDVESIDAINVPDLAVAVIDGTAPHTFDPALPGVTGEIVDLAAYQDGAQIRSARPRILELHAAGRFRFDRAYDALAAARCSRNEWAAYYGQALDLGAVHTRADALTADLLSGHAAAGPGGLRRLFASAITPTGFNHRLESIMDPLSTCCLITGEPGTGKQILLTCIVNAAMRKGFAVETFCCALDPQKYEHATIPELGLGIITATWPHQYTARAGDLMIDTAEFVDAAKLAGYRSEIGEARRAYLTALERAVYHLDLAKHMHGQLEALYRPHINFSAIEARRQAIYREVLRDADPAPVAAARRPPAGALAAGDP